MRNVLFLLVLLFINSELVWSQPHIKRVEGNLSQSSVTKILQDDLGFIWVGTRHGLNRYKGHEFDVFQPDGAAGKSLTTSNITTLVKDVYGNIWVGTVDGGINFYDVKKGTFQAFRHDPENLNSPAEDLIRAMHADSSGNLFIGYQNGGMDLLDIKQNKFTHFTRDPNNPFSIPDNHIHAIVSDGHDNIWLGTNDNGIAKFDLKGKRFYPYQMIDMHGKNIRTVRSMYADKNDFIVGTNNGIFLFDFLNQKFKQLVTNEIINQNPILSLLIDQKGKIMIGSENFGIFIIDKENSDIINLMPQNSIWNLYQDKNGIIWIGSYKNGLHKIDPYENYFENHKHVPLASNSLSYNIVSSFTEDPEGNLWIGTDGGGLNYYDISQKKYTRLNDDVTNKTTINSSAILDLLYDEQDNFYVATWKGGVNIKKKGENKFRILDNQNGLLGNNTYDIIQDHSGQIWIVSFAEGITIYNPYDQSIDYLQSKEIGSVALRTVVEDKQHNKWIGTEGQGLFKINVNEKNEIIEKFHYQSESGNDKKISSNLITYIYESNDGTIWIGTEGSGLNKYNPLDDSFTKYAESDGLGSDLVYGIIEDDQGYLWISTLKGLSRFNKEDSSFKNFKVSGNKQSTEFFKGACYKLQNGELLFGSTEGYFKFNPSDITSNLTLPSVYISSILVNGEDYADKKGENTFLIEELWLKHSENDIDLSYCALNYSDPEKTQFEYKLIGYDKNWSKVTNRHEVKYTNLPPGNYEFIIKASNNDDLWNNEGAHLKINVSDPWWNTLWAYTIYILISIFLIWYGRQLIIYREKLKNDLKIEHLELMKMQEVDEMKSKFFTNISHEFRTPLTLLLGPLKVLLEGGGKSDPQKHYHTMHRNANKLLRLINEILELSKLESGSTKVQFTQTDVVEFIKPIALSFTELAERKYIDYQCIFPSHPINLYFDKVKVEKIVLNILSNAFKNTAEFGKIRFQLKENESETIVEIGDSGKGIPPEHLTHIFDRFYQVDTKVQGTGIGLALTKELVELHKGLIEVESKLDQGTTFRVKFLKGKAHVEENQIIKPESESSQIDSRVSDLIQDGNIQEIYTEESLDDEPNNKNNAPTVLIVEDNEDMRKFVVEQLKESYQILEAADGKEGHQIALRQNPDVIVSDIMMPEMDGLEFCKKIKEDKNTSHISVILLTAKASLENVEVGLETGADYYMTKPFSPRLLELRVKNILHTREQVRNHIINGPESSLSPKEIKISSRDQEFLKNIREYIETNMSDSNFGIDNLCNEFGMSRTQLFRKLKALVGQSATEFIRSFRLKRAAQLLRSEEFTVAEVTYKVGFNDLKYFRNCFKKQFGVNPSEYMAETC